MNVVANIFENISHKAHKNWGAVFATLFAGLLCVLSFWGFIALSLVNQPNLADAATGFQGVAIDTVSDADIAAGGSHTKSYANSDTLSNFTLSGDGVNTNQYFSPSTGSASSGGIWNSFSGQCVIGATLTPPGSGNHNGAVAFNQQVDMTKGWTLDFDLDLQKLNAGGQFSANGAGDFIGLIVTPVPPSKAGTGGTAGGLGILNLPNTESWGIDFYNNGTGSPYYDPSILQSPGGSWNYGNQVAGFRHTDSSGALAPWVSGTALGTDQSSAFTVLTGIGNGNQSTSVNWGTTSGSCGGATGNTPYIVANSVATYTYLGNVNGVETGQLQIEVKGQVPVDTYQVMPNTTYTQTFALPSTSMSVAIAASDGGQYSRLGATINEFEISLGTGTTVVNYVDQNGVAIPAMPSTQIVANTGESLAINGLSPNAASATYSYDAPDIPGYTVSSANFVTVASDTVSGSTTTPGNTMTIQYQGDTQTVEVTIACPSSVTTPCPNSQTLTQTGVTAGAFSFNIAGNIPSGYHLAPVNGSNSNALVSAGALTGTYDNTDNGAATPDTTIQSYKIDIIPDIQTLNITYIFPTNHDLSSSLTTVQQTETAATSAELGAIAIPQIDGYTSSYTYNGAKTAATTIPAITADATSNGEATTDPISDLAPQTVTVTYTANARQITVNYPGADTMPEGCTQTTPIIITQNSSGQAYLTDGNYDTVEILQCYGATSFLSATINGTTTATTAAKSYPSGSFSAYDITLTVTYQIWSATVYYYSQLVDNSGATLGAVTSVPAPHASYAGELDTDFAGQLGASTTDQTANLQTDSAIESGYHVTTSYWSDTPDGRSVDAIPPYQASSWDFSNMTNMGTGDVPQYQAAIVFRYTADTQQAIVTVSGAPANSNVANGATTYAGVTGASQVVSVPTIEGYTATVTNDSDDVSSMAIATQNNQFTFTYDSTNNGNAATDKSVQNFTVTYLPITALVVVNYTYQDGISADVTASASTDTVDYTAPALPQTAQINTQTGGTYSVTVQNVTGYTWVIADSKGNVYNSSTLPQSFTSDGSSITYTVTYSPITTTQTINFYEATYDATGAYTFTNNPVPGMSPISQSGAVGSIWQYSITNPPIIPPAGWGLDPMNAALGSLTDSSEDASNTDSDNLNGGSPAKRLVFLANNQTYSVYLARDIQSVEVQFSGTPASAPISESSTQYYDGRTGGSFSIDNSGFAIPGYTYTITNPSNSIVTSINGVYDSTANNNASSPVFNNGDGDTSPQIFTVAYTADFQQAILRTDASAPAGAGGTASGAKIVATQNGTTDARISFDAEIEASLSVPGYTESFQGPNGLLYSSLSAAIVANNTFDNTDNTGSADISPQYFTVSYSPQTQKAVLNTGSTDPNGASVITSVTGATDTTISFSPKTDSDLIKAGYSYTVTYQGAGSNNGTSYLTLAAALTANPNFDNTENAGRTADSTPQYFTANYTANSQTVNIEYVYSNIDASRKKGTVPTADFATTPTPQQTSQTATSNAEGTAITVPSINGYTPNATIVTPNFAIDSAGNLVEPTLTVTYSANAQNATFTYLDTNGADISQYISNSPTSSSGVTDQQIIPASQVPTAPGYTISGFSLNVGNLQQLSALQSALYTTPDGTPDTLSFIYAPNQMTANIYYVFQLPSEYNGIFNGETITYAGDNGQPVPAVGGAPVTGVINQANTVVSALVLPDTNWSVTPAIQNISWAVNSDGSPIKSDYYFYVSPIESGVTINYVDSNNESLLLWIAQSVSNQPSFSVKGEGGENIPTSGAINIPGYTFESCVYNGDTITDSEDCEVITYIVGQDTLTFNYAPNSQTVTVHCTYSSGGMSGQNFKTSDLSGESNGDTPNTVTATGACGTEPTGYTVSGPSSQSVSWAINSTGDSIGDMAGQLTMPNLYFYYAANSASAVINYGVSQVDDSLNQAVPSGTIIGISTGLTASTITNSGAVNLPGYTFKELYYNGALVATTAQSADTYLATYSPAAGATTDSIPDKLTFVYEPNQGQVTYNYVDTNGATIAPAIIGTGITTSGDLDIANMLETIDGYTYSSVTGQTTMPVTGNATVTYIYSADFQQVSVSFVGAADGAPSIAPAQTINGVSAAAIDYTTNSDGVVINYNIPGYTLQTDGRLVAFRFDTTAGNGQPGAESTDSAVQNIQMVYTPDIQTVKVHYVIGSSTGTHLHSVVTLTGITDETVDYSSLATAIPGYKLITDGRDTSQTYNSDQTLVQNVYLIYLPYVQDALISILGNNPCELANPVETTPGYTHAPIRFIDTDTNLYCQGYSYVVIGPDDATYTTLASAVAGTPLYDATDNVETHPITDTPPSIIPTASITTDTDDSAQVFQIVYTALPESAIVQTINDPAGDHSFAAVTGVTAGLIPTLNVLDTDLAREGYTYTVTGPDGETYLTLEDALAGNPIFDNDITHLQIFNVIYDFVPKPVPVVPTPPEPPIPPTPPNPDDGSSATSDSLGSASLATAATGFPALPFVALLILLMAFGLNLSYVRKL